MHDTKLQTTSSRRTKRPRLRDTGVRMQVAIITGSGQGLGAAAAKLFAENGAKVVVTDLDGAKAELVSRPVLLRHPEGYMFPANGDISKRTCFTQPAYGSWRRSVHAQYMFKCVSLPDGQMCRLLLFSLRPWPAI